MATSFMACASDIFTLHIFFFRPPLSSSVLLPFCRLTRPTPRLLHLLSLPLSFFRLLLHQTRCMSSYSSLSSAVFPPFFSSQESVNMRKFYSGVIFLNLKFVRRYNDNKIRVHLDLIGCFCGLFFYPTLAIFLERENSNSSNIKHKT